MNLFYAHSGGITDRDTKSLCVETKRYRDYQGLQVLGSQFTCFTGV